MMAAMTLHYSFDIGFCARWRVGSGRTRSCLSDNRRCFVNGDRLAVARCSNSCREQYPRFYYTNTDASGLERVAVGCVVKLDPEETRHACTVLRLQPGAMLEVCDGRGNVVECELMHGADESVSSKGRGRRGEKKPMASVVVRDWVVRRGEEVGLALQQGPCTGHTCVRWSVAVACGSLKGGRGDWVVEKCAELGATDFVPLLTERSPSLGRSKGREERWERLAFAAMKQSLGVYAMKVHPPVESVKDLVDQYLDFDVSSTFSTSNDGDGSLHDADGGVLSNQRELKEERRTEERRLCALVGAQGAEPLYSALTNLSLATKGQRVSHGILIIGPEGDFTAAEYARLVEAGVLPVSLGERRLRTETAAVAMLSCMVAMR